VFSALILIDFDFEFSALSLNFYDFLPGGQLDMLKMDRQYAVGKDAKR
jgi:hypothetical protein